MRTQRCPVNNSVAASRLAGSTSPTFTLSTSRTESAGAMICISANCESISASCARACATRIFAAATFFSCAFAALSARSASVAETTLRLSKSCWRRASSCRKCNCASCASASWIAVSICAAARSRRARSSEASSCTMTWPSCKWSPSQAKIFSTRPPARGPTCASSTSIVPETALRRVLQPTTSVEQTTRSASNERLSILTSVNNFVASRIKAEMQSAGRSGLSRERAFENDFENSGETFFWSHSQLLYLRRIHDPLDHGKQNLDHELHRNVFAHHSRALTLDEKLSEEMPDQSGPTAFDNLEHVRRFLAHIANEWRLDLIQFVLRVGQQFVQRRRKITRMCMCDFIQFRLDARELILQHRLK